MPKAILIPRGDIDAMFRVLDLLGKIDRLEPSTDEVRHVPATSPRSPGGMSCYGIHRRSDGTHVATTHIIRMPDGSEPHRHGKDLLLGSVKFAAVAERAVGMRDISVDAPGSGFAGRFESERRVSEAAGLAIMQSHEDCGTVRLLEV